MHQTTYLRIRTLEGVITEGVIPEIACRVMLLHCIVSEQLIICSLISEFTVELVDKAVPNTPHALFMSYRVLADIVITKCPSKIDHRVRHDQIA